MPSVRWSVVQKPKCFGGLGYMRCHIEEYRFGTKVVGGDSTKKIVRIGSPLCARATTLIEEQKGVNSGSVWATIGSLQQKEPELVRMFLEGLQLQVGDGTNTKIAAKVTTEHGMDLHGNEDWFSEDRSGSG
ncbi:hypothetical protein PIB30_035371 [Stylosanthes scabra]|uniref:Uncharacterized protein n=1 Tax=Stylosanthes scabra TaxID=79078 RepID=A0ABU6XBI3_9FABA|nr:hypothetical protein [Stylosanthes scabra]